MARNRIIGRRMAQRADRLEASLHQTTDVAQQQMIMLQAAFSRTFANFFEELEDGVSVGLRRTSTDHTPLDFLRGKCDVAPFELFIDPSAKKED